MTFAQVLQNAQDVGNGKQKGLRVKDLVYRT